MIINHNLSAIESHRFLKIEGKDLNNVAGTLASGQRINKAADDAAGLAVSEKMRAQIGGLHQASRNAQDAISMVQTAEGYLSETTSLLQRMRELSVQSATGTYTKEDRAMIQTEVTQLVQEVNRISEQAEFNTIKVLKDLTSSSQLPGASEATTAATTPTANGVAANTLRVHIGPNTNQTMEIKINNMSATSLGVENAVNVETQESANASLPMLDKALFTVNKQRADIGAFQNRLEMVIKGTDITAQNLQSAESQIRDTDMANAMVDFVRGSILSQATASMLSQANVRPNLVMKVLG